MKSNNILYISYDGMTDPLGQSQVLPYIIGLTKAGYEFWLISFEKEEKLKLNKPIIEKICNENNIHWYPLIYTKKPPVLSTLKDLNTLQKLAKNLHLRNDFSLVHCRSYIPALVGLEMKQKYGTKFLFDMRGLWADEKVDAGAWNRKNPIFNWVYKFFKKKETAFFENADYSVSLTYAGRNEIHSWESIKKNPVPIEVIPCCVDTKHFERNALSNDLRDKLKQELKIVETDFILSYLGSIGTWYMLDEMLDFFIVLLQQKPTAKFLFITGDEHEKIKATALKKNIPLEKVIIRSGQRSEVPALISLSHLSVFFIRSTYSKISSSPTKLAELMAMGIPVICNAGVGDTNTIMLESNAGALVDSFNVKEYEIAIQKLAINPVNSDNTVKYTLTHFTVESAVEKYTKLYKIILE